MSRRNANSGGLGKMLSMFNTSPEEKELEIGLAIQYPNKQSSSAMKTREDVWTKLIDGLTKQSTSDMYVQQHLDVHYDNNIRRRIMFVDGVNQHKDIWIRKTTIQKTDIDFAIQEIYKTRVKLSSEIPSVQTNKAPLFMRAKIRFIFTIGKVRVEVDLVKNLKNKEPMLKPILSDLFSTSNASSINHSLWDELRAEIEMTAPTTKDDIFACKQLMVECFGSETTSDYQSFVFKVANFILPRGRFLDSFRQQNGLKKLLNSVVDMSTSIYWETVQPNIANYFVTDKVDGTRGVCIVSNDSVVILTNKVITRNRTVKKSSDEKSTSDDVYIFDCEYLESKDKLFLFDIIVSEGSSVVRKQFDERLDLLKNAPLSGVDCIVKEYIRTENPADIKKFYDKKREYDIDGLIWVPSKDTGENTEYSKMVCYKWKPVELKTIDFYLKRVPNNILKHKPFSDISVQNPSVVYTMFVGISPYDQDKLGIALMNNYSVIVGSKPNTHTKQIYPIQFSTADKPINYIYQPPVDLKDREKLDGKIVEMSWDAKGQKWVYHRIRTDRDVELARGNYFGNYYRIAELTWQSIINPLTMDDIVSKNKGYFKQTDNSTYRNQRWFNSFVKTQLLEKLFDTRLAKGFQKGNTIAIDLASGKGQDLARLANIGVSKCLFVDADADALAELTTRRHNFKKIHGNIEVKTQLADLTAPAKKTIALMSDHGFDKNSVDLIVCNFAIHYIIHSEDSLKNLWELVSYYIKPGGRFMFTCFDGTKIMSLLNSGGVPTPWTAWENDVVKYKIEPKFSDINVQPIGQKIGVLLPFSMGETVDEYLVDIDRVNKFWSDNGWSIEARGSFTDFIDMYNKPLSDIDKEYVGLYGYSILQKNMSDTVVWKSNLQSLLPKHSGIKTGGAESDVSSSNSLSVLENVQRSNCILIVVPDTLNKEQQEHVSECMETVGYRNGMLNKRIRKSVYKIVDPRDLLSEINKCSNCSVIVVEENAHLYASDYAQYMCKLPIMTVCIHTRGGDIWCMSSTDVLDLGVDGVKTKAEWSESLGN